MILLCHDIVAKLLLGLCRCLLDAVLIGVFVSPEAQQARPEARDSLLH